MARRYASESEAAGSELPAPAAEESANAEPTEADKQAAADALPKAKLPRPSAEALEAARALLKQAEDIEQEEEKADPKGWGPGKPGKKKCHIPPLPRGLGVLTVTHNVPLIKPDGKPLLDKDGEPMNRIVVKRIEGVVELTFDEFHEYLHRIDNLRRQDMASRDPSLAKHVNALFDSTSGAWVENKHDGKPAPGLAGIF